MKKEEHRCIIWEVLDINHLRLIRNQFPLLPPLVLSGEICVYRIDNLADKLPPGIMHDSRSLNKFLRGKFIKVLVSGGNGSYGNPFTATITGEIMEQLKPKD